MGRHYANLLAAAVSKPQVRISELPLLAEGERRLMLEERGRGAVRPWGEPQPVHELFADQVTRSPEAVAVECGAERLSYEELDRRARSLSRRLGELGVGRGDLVGVCMERSAALVAALLGVLKAGGAYVPVDPATPHRRVAELLSDAGVKAVICDETTEALVSDVGAHMLRAGDGVWDEESLAASNEVAPVEVSADDLAYVIYTSGSTGKPKGVAIQHDSLFNLVRWHQDAYQVTSADRATQLAGPAFDASVWELWPYLTAGAAIYIPSQEIYTTPPKVVGRERDLRLLPADAIGRDSARGNVAGRHGAPFSPHWRRPFAQSCAGRRAFHLRQPLRADGEYSRHDMRPGRRLRHNARHRTSHRPTDR
jgi:non-ribosomal peptide synthetase component F